MEVVGREDFLDYHRVGRGDRQTAGMGPASCADQLLLLMMQPGRLVCVPYARCCSSVCVVVVVVGVVQDLCAELPGEGEFEEAVQAAWGPRT